MHSLQRAFPPPMQQHEAGCSKLFRCNTSLPLIVCKCSIICVLFFTDKRVPLHAELREVKVQFTGTRCKKQNAKSNSIRSNDKTVEIKVVKMSPRITAWKPEQQSPEQFVGHTWRRHWPAQHQMLRAGIGGARALCIPCASC